MVRFLPVATCLVLATAGPLCAQLSDVNPYSPDPQSTLSTWPVFYKLPPGHKLQYYLMGWCGSAGRGARYDQWYRENCTFNVNTLPEASLEGTIVRATDAVLTVKDASGQVVTVVLYPDLAVTDTHVLGVAAPSALKRDVWVRFVGTVAGKAEVADPVANLEVYSPRAGDNFPRIALGVRQTIAGRLVRGSVRHWLLKPARAGQIGLVDFTLAPDAQLTFDVGRLDQVAPGQKVEVRGRLWDVEGQLLAAQPKPGFFADRPPPELSPAQLDALRQQLVPVLYACQVSIHTAGVPQVSPGPLKSNYSYAHPTASRGM